MEAIIFLAAKLVFGALISVLAATFALMTYDALCD